MKKYVLLIPILLIFCLNGCNALSNIQPITLSAPVVITPISTSTLSPLPNIFPKIDRHPEPANWNRGALPSVPTYNPDSYQIGQMDLRSYNLAFLDFSNSFTDLMYASFDDQTKWPSDDKMPKNFDWQTIMEIGKNPGLGVRQLHALGITGRGVGIAIIDQTLLVDHQEYANQLRLYEETDDIQGGWLVTQMHGPAVASIAVGKTVGVAPEADLYYIATSMCNTAGTYEGNDYSCLAKGVRRILEINKLLPEDRKIRVISISVGWEPGSKGYDDITAAVNEAKNAGLFVISSSVYQYYGFIFMGIGREPLDNPDQFESYEPGLFWAEQFYEGDRFSDRLLIPMDSRTTASPTGTDEYVFYREGGWSWSIPYIAGVYGLAAQVEPTITPDKFWSLALETGKTIDLKYQRETIHFGPIIDPVALIASLQEKSN
jgi:subtilisin family serine protease